MSAEERDLSLAEAEKLALRVAYAGAILEGCKCRRTTYKIIDQEEFDAESAFWIGGCFADILLDHERRCPLYKLDPVPSRANPFRDAPALAALRVA